MTDTIIKGTGNSRTLKTVPNALTLYPNFEAMIAAMIEGSFPIDLGPLNQNGLNIRGSDLNKESLLTDITENSIWGNTENRTVNAALAQLRSLITTAQNSANNAQNTANSANTGIRYVTGTYTGAQETSKTIEFGIKWEMCIIVGFHSTTTTGNPVFICMHGANYAARPANIKDTMTYTNTSLTITNTSYVANAQNTNYYYFAIGTK